MKQWTIETVVTQLHRTVLDTTGVDIFEVDNDYSVEQMLEALRAAAFKSHMPTLVRKGEYPGQTSLDEIEAETDEPSRGRDAG